MKKIDRFMSVFLSSTRSTFDFEQRGRKLTLARTRALTTLRVFLFRVKQFGRAIRHAGDGFEVTLRQQVFGWGRVNRGVFLLNAPLTRRLFRLFRLREKNYRENAATSHDQKPQQR